MKLRSILIPVLLLVWIFTVQTVNAQYYFGQNKVRYSQFDWQVLNTDHFDIYFYPEEEEIAQAAAKLAEESYLYLQEKFNHTVEKKIPFIVYSSPVFFSQTNIIPGILPENVAGFTEFSKQRVVIPYNGSFSDFDHVIRHELVHVFTIQKLEYVVKMHRKNNIAAPPLWFTEGIAEYWSQGWNSEADMFLRDMTISGNIISVERLNAISGTFIMYKVGQSILKYIGETYGDDKLTDLFDNWWRGKTFSDIIKLNYGKTLEEIGSEWEYDLKKKYYPHLETQELPDRVAQKLTKEGYNMKPCVFLKDTKKGREEYIVFKTFRMGYSQIAEMPLEGGEKKNLKTLIKGGRSEEFESLHLIQSGLDVNSNGIIVFTSKAHESDVLYFYDTRRGKIIKKVRDKSLISITSPSWSPDGNSCVFEGITKSGKSDLYLYDIDKDKFTQLTDDIYIDRTPSFSYTDNIIAFSSDRHSNGLEGSQNLYLYNLATGAISQLTSGDHIDESPKWTRKGDKILYASNRNGSMNIYTLDGVTNGHRVSGQLTNFITGAFDPVITNFDSTIVFTGYQNFGYQIYKMELPSEPLAVYDEEPSLTDYWKLTDSWDIPRLKGKQTPSTVKYKTQMSFDIAQSAVAYDAVAGTMGGLQFALTDMLSNHQWYFLLYNTANTREEFFKSVNFAATYMNKSKRINYGGGIYHFYYEYYDDYLGYVNERTYGGLLTASYPLSIYRRIESSIYIRRLDKVSFIGDDTRATTATATINYIKDTSLWDPTGPIDGTRINIGMSQSIEVKNFQYFNSSYNIDFRKYFRLGKASAYATRAMFLHSVGKDPQRYYLGGSWSLRGYERRSFYGRSLLLFNNELRFPLVNDLYVGFPFGAIRFQAIRGALFFDAGNAWEDEFSRLKGSVGFGFRVSLGYVAVLRFDFARKTDFKNISNKYDFDFFFGWNF